MRKQLYCLQPSCLGIYQITRGDSGDFIVMWFVLFRLTWRFYCWKVCIWLAGNLALISIVFSHLLCAKGRMLCLYHLCTVKCLGYFVSFLFTGPLLVLPPEPRLEDLTSAQHCQLSQAWLSGESGSGVVRCSLPVFLTLFLSWYCCLGSWCSSVTPKLVHGCNLVRQVSTFCWHMIARPWVHGSLNIVGKLLWLHHTEHPVLHALLYETRKQAVPI